MMGHITSFLAHAGVSPALDNLSNVAINTALLPDTHNTYDFGASANRWKDGYFQGMLTVYDLTVESGSSIKLAGATFENKGHYTSVDTNWVVQHNDSTTAFIGVYAENTGVMTHANLVLDSQGSTLNLLKNSPIHPWTPNAAGIVNEDGPYGTFVHEGEDISWSHFTELTKDEYGNVTYMSGIMSMMRLEHDPTHTLLLERVDLHIEDEANPGTTVVALSAVGESYINNSAGFAIGKTSIDIGFALDVNGNLQVDDITCDRINITQRQNGFYFFAGSDNDIDLFHWDTTSLSGYFKWDDSAGAYSLDHPLRLNQEDADYGGVLWLDESNTGPSTAEGGAGHQIWVGSDHTLKWTNHVGDTENLSVASKSYNHTTGWLEGGQISINSGDDTLIDVTAGTIVVSDYSDPANHVDTIISWMAQTGLNPGLAGRSTWIGVQDDGSGDAEFVFDPSFDSIERRTTGILGRIWDNAGTGPSITNVGDYERPTWGLTTAFQDFILEYGSWNISGNKYSPNGANLTLDKSAGSSYRYHTEDTIGSQNVHTDAAQTPRTTYAYHLQGLSTVESQSTIQPDYYDLSGVKTAVPSGKWTSQELWFFPVSGTCHVLYGQAYYNSKGDTLANLTTEDKVRNGEILDGAIKRAYLVVKQGCTELDDVDTAELREVNGSAGGGSSYWQRDDGVLTPAEAGDVIKAEKFVVDGTTDYTIDIQYGYLYIANSLIYDGAWWFDDGELHVGNDMSEGLLVLHSMDGGNQGGKLQLEVPKDLDDDITTYDINVYEDDLTFGPNTDPDAFQFTATGAAVVAAFNVDLTVNGELAALTLTGDGSALTMGIEQYRIPFGAADGSLQDNSGFWYNGVDFYCLGTGNPYFVKSGHQKLYVQSTTDANTFVSLWSGASGGLQKGVMGYSSADDCLVLAHDESGATLSTAGIKIKEGKFGIGATPTWDFHLEKSSSGTISALMYNSSPTDAIMDFMVLANGAGDLHLVSNNGPGLFYDVPQGAAGIVVTNGQKLQIGVGNSGYAPKMLLFDGAAQTIEVGSGVYFDFTDETGVKLDLHGGNYAIGVESSELRVASNEDIIFYTGGYTGTEIARMEADGMLKVTGGVRAPEIWSSGDLKIQPDVQGNIECFGDSDVGNAENGNMLYVRRMAAEGNNYMRFYITSSRTGMIHSNANMTLQGQTSFSINSIDDDIFLKVGDTNGSKKVYFRDKDGTDVASIDSNGKSWFAGDMDTDVGIGANDIELSSILFHDGSTISRTNLSPFTWHIGNARYEGTKDLDTETDGPSGVAFSTDGKKFFVVDNQLDKVFEYDLSTAWDITSATYNSANFTTTGSSNPQGIYFKPDGKKMYLADAGDDEINEYDLSTAWDITSAGWVGLKGIPSSSPNGVFFRPDGRRMYVSDGTNENVGQYSLSTPWDVTTATWTNNFGTSIDAVEDVSFKPDGTKMYIVDGSAEDDIHEFELTTPWQINTAVLTALHHIYEDSIPNGITFRPDGTRMYVVGNNTNSLYEYHLGIVCPHVAIGHAGVYGQLPLDVRSNDDNQIYVHDARDQAVNRGGGIMLGGTYTNGGAEAIGARVGIRKPNSISGEMEFDLTFETMNGSVLTEAFRVTSDQQVGFGTIDPDYRVEIEGDEQYLLHIDCSDPYALGSGGGILFGGRYTGGSSPGRGGYIGIEKWSAGNGELGFDLVFQSHKNSVGDMTEMLRLSAEDGTATIAGAIIEHQAGLVHDNWSFGAALPEFLTTTVADLQGNIFIGEGHAVNVGQTSGLISGLGNILIGDSCGKYLDGTGSGAAGEHHYNILIGDSCGTLGRLDDYNILIGWAAECVTGTYEACINIGGLIFGDASDAANPRLRIGGGVGTSLLTSAALEIKSVTGALVVPRMTTSQRTALTAVNGMIIYDTSQNAFRKYQNGSWAGF